MSYQAARFNHHQNAIRSMQDIANGNPTINETSSVAQSPIRYAKDLLVASTTTAAINGTPAASAQTLTNNTATTTQAQAAAAKVDTDSAQNTAFQSSSSSPQKTYATAQEIGKEVSKNDTDVAMVMWLASILFLMIPGMLVLLKHDASPYLKQQAREAVNWTSTVMLGSILCTVLVLVFIGGPLQIVLTIAHLVFCLMGANAARQGHAFRVPMSWRPLQD